jgi:hypothetical protein
MEKPAVSVTVSTKANGTAPAATSHGFWNKNVGPGAAIAPVRPTPSQRSTAGDHAGPSSASRADPARAVIPSTRRRPASSARASGVEAPPQVGTRPSRRPRAMECAQADGGDGSGRRRELRPHGQRPPIMSAGRNPGSGCAPPPAPTGGGADRAGRGRPPEWSKPAPFRRQAFPRERLEGRPASVPSLRTAARSAAGAAAPSFWIPSRGRNLRLHGRDVVRRVGTAAGAFSAGGEGSLIDGGDGRSATCGRAPPDLTRPLDPAAGACAEAWSPRSP